MNPRRTEDAAADGSNPPDAEAEPDRTTGASPPIEETRAGALRRNGPVATGDMQRAVLGQLDWSVPGREESLAEVFDHAVGVATTAEGWYRAKKQSKRRGAIWLRVAAIVLTAVAAILPIVGQIFTDANGAPAIAPGWAAVVLGVAAALIGLDRFFGFTSAWMRFISAELAIASLRRDFEYEWETARAAVSTLTSEYVKDRLAKAHELEKAVDDAVAAETNTWIAEFTTTLGAADKNIEPKEGD